MAKKKATMTLKDFHGGSIPSDLPLPSAPGVSVRPLDRNGFDRQTPWGSTAGRTDHKLRPGSAGASRNFDEKTPFLNHNAHIGRNFDEDERKPLDGVSVPRRMVSDESLRAQPSHVEPRKDNISDGRARSRPVTAPVSQISSGTTSGSYASRFTEANNAGVNTQTFGGNSRVNVTSSNVGAVGGQAVIGSYSNAWGLKKEATGIKEPVATGWSALDTASKLAHASALEKVSSGRWHSKQQMSFPTEVEVLKHQETKRESYYRGGESYDRNAYSVSDAVDGMDYNNKSLVMHAERNLALGDGIHVASNKELPAHERVHSPVFMDSLEKRASATINGVQCSQYAVKHGEPEPQSSVPSEALERPKLKLLPRSKPLENYEPPTDYKQGHQQQTDPVRLEYGGNMPESCNPHKHVFVGYEAGDRAVERPKLNLKPRSQPLEQLNDDEKGKRNTVFGGALPREVVLKARGVDDTGTNDYDRQLFSRNKQDASRTETGQVHATRFNGRAENIVTDNRTAGNTDRRDPRFNGQRSDMQRRNRQSENPRNGRDREIERYHHQQPQAQDRPTSPETWRKPVEHPKPSSDAPVVRYGKVASAIELATAFSKSVSDPSADCFSGQRNLTSRNQAPFSRLMGPPTRPQAQINSY